MEKKFLKWAEMFNINVKKIEKLNTGNIKLGYAEIENVIIYETFFKAARLKGFQIQGIKPIVNINGKFEGIALWIEEIKGE